MAIRATFRKFEKDNLLGFVDVYVGDWVIKKGKVYRTQKGGIFYSSPSLFNKKAEKWEEVAHPITAGGRTELYDAIRDAMANEEGNEEENRVPKKTPFQKQMAEKPSSSKATSSLFKKKTEEPAEEEGEATTSDDGLEDIPF